MNADLCLVAIAKDEARYLPEWISYHLAVGYEYIIVYDNDSSDATREILEVIGSFLPVLVIPWPSIPRKSPQRSAYLHSLTLLPPNAWVSFFDVDEFLVPFDYAGAKEYFDAAPKEGGSISINWKCFGSSGVCDDNYDTVIETFTKSSTRSWRNNCHFKSSARVGCIDEPHIHEIRLRSGMRLASDFSELQLGEEGKTIVPIYGGVQLNHYQTKTWAEFSQRMARGNANFPPGHPQHGRDGTRARFDSLDQNAEDDLNILPFSRRSKDMLSEIRSKIQAHLAAF